MTELLLMLCLPQVIGYLWVLRYRQKELSALYAMASQEIEVAFDPERSRFVVTVLDRRTSSGMIFESGYKKRWS